MTTRMAEALLSGLTSSNRSEASTRLPLETQIAALRDKARRMNEKCPFKVGDLVTARAEADMKGAGEPHVVVEVFESAITDHNSEAGSNQFLRKFDMRVAHYAGANMTVHAVDHSAFEHWTDRHAEDWHRRLEATMPAKSVGAVSADAPLTEVVRLLRNEGRRLLDARISWKKGDLVEIMGYKESRATRPMMFEGRAIGLVEKVDHGDDTTRVVYFDSDGDRCAQWFKPVDLKPYSVVEPVDTT